VSTLKLFSESPVFVSLWRKLGRSNTVKEGLIPTTVGRNSLCRIKGVSFGLKQRKRRKIHARLFLPTLGLAPKK
jgi:hypothetical protein